MRKTMYLTVFISVLLFIGGCSTAYKAKPLPFKAPSSYPNAQEVAGAVVAARAYVDPAEAKEAFGFDIREAGMLPIQVAFDNQGTHPLEIDASQTFLEDNEGNLWPVLDRNFAYERVTKYTQTKEIFKEGAYGGFLGAAAGALVGAAVGVVSGQNVGEAVGKGAVAGAAAGGVLGGIKGATSNEASRSVMEDFNNKSLQSKPVGPKSLAYGFIFYPGEAKSAKQLRLKIVEKDTGLSHVIIMGF